MILYFKCNNIILVDFIVLIYFKEVTSTKAFEDRANNILSEIRKQRRSLHLEYNVGKVTFITYSILRFGLMNSINSYLNVNLR